jgi:hypothetical protein
LADLPGDRELLGLAGKRLVQQLSDLGNLGRPAHDIDGRVAEQLVAKALRHATDDGHDEFRPVLLQVLEVPQVREDPLLGMLSYGARIDQYGIGLFDIVRQTEARLLQRGTDQRRIQLVHLATEAQNMHGLPTLIC